MDFGKKNEYRVFTLKLLIILGILLSVFVLFQIFNLVLIFIFAIFLNILFAPFLNRLNKRKVPDWLGIVIIYIILILILVILFSAIIPIFAGEIGKVIGNLISYINQTEKNYKQSGINGLGLPSFIVNTFYPFLTRIDFASILDTLKSNFLEIGNFFTNHFSNFIVSGFGIVSSITGAIFNLILTFIFAFFIALERKDIKSFFYKIMPKNISKYIERKEVLITSTLNHWLKGQLLLCLTVFLFTSIGLNIIRIFGVNMHFSETLTLGLIAGLMEFVPYAGPFLALIPAATIAGNLGFNAVIIIIILYIIIQETENNVFVPIIMSKAVKVSPFAVLLAMAIGASLFGILGILVAVPIVSIINVFLDDYFKFRK